ncbi:VWA domain-containing protein [Actinophytocola oryzae]|uniref:von Willebrand factor type A domain-containing protein n=1 Tax=Actinophytocola oryzae TaxID=502181 RepID=A0A4R7UW47_9PSEU|nr:vWA domain-containing protein [Actinophytocola oryzae]TDV40979.1 von Willebrand factor type A domain-containing protein [Actinophytocola oryzae]
MRRLAVLLVALLSAAFPSASADPGVTADELLDLVGGQVSTHVVILVDTSASMATGGRYGYVTAAVEGFVAALGPADTASVIPFDEAAGTTCHASPGDPTLAGCVPHGPPTGSYTDIGRAIAAALSDAEAHPGSIVVLVSDGDHEPTDSSEYPAPPSATAPGWQGLRARAAALSDVTAYALPLAGSSGVNALDVVFPGARTLTASSPADLQTELATVTEPRRRAVTQQRLAADAHPTVTATWVGAPVNGESGHGTATLRLRSGATHVPLTVTLTRLRAAGHPIQADLPAPVTLAPGAAADVAIPLTWRPPAEEGLWRRTAGMSSTLTLSATVGTPWAGALRDLRIDVRPGLAPPEPLRLTWNRDLGWTGTARTVGVLLAIVLVAASTTAGRRSWRRRYPAPTGKVRARPLFGTEWSDPLPVGRLAAIRRRSAAGFPGTVVIRYRGVRDTPGGTREPVYVIHYTPPPTRDRRPAQDWSHCRPGASILVNGTLFTHENP